MKRQHSTEFLRKRKFLMVLPLLVLPFLTMAFWALGGGKENDDLTAVKDIQKGFNTELPQAKFSPNEKHDKFSIYESLAKETNETDDFNSQFAFSERQSGFVDPNEERINQKLAQINAEINRENIDESNYSSIRKSPPSEDMTADVNRLEILMQNMKGESEIDPEMQQLNSLLEKILEIQNPDRASEKQREASLDNAIGVYAVKLVDSAANKQNLFSSNKEINNQYADYAANAIEATIHQDQQVVSGSVVKLRLLDSIFVNGTLIPKNEFVYGIASVNAERLKIEIATLRFQNSILPVALSAYDMDGLEGLYIPGAITRDVAKNGVDEAIQNLQIMTMDPSVSAQVAEAGIQTAKGLFSKKAKQVKVKVKAGYQLLLRDNNQRN